MELSKRECKPFLDAIKNTLKTEQLVTWEGNKPIFAEANAHWLVAYTKCEGAFDLLREAKKELEKIK